MSTAAFRHPREHVADLLPAFVNGSLDRETRVVVLRHLAQCDDCMQSLAAWRAIAGATAAGVVRLERRIAESVTILGSVIPQSTSTPKETTVYPSPIAAPAALIGSPLLGVRTLGRAIQPVNRLVAAIAITLSVGAGIYAFANTGPEGGPNALAPGGASHQAGQCTATELTDRQLAEAVYLPGTLDGVYRDQASYVDPAVAWDDPNAMPNGATADQATIDAVTAVWTQFQACYGANGAQALSLMSQDGIRRVYYRYVYQNIDETFLDRQANDPKIRNQTDAAGATPTAEAKPYPNGVPTDVHYTPSSPAGLTVTEVRVLPDGRVIAGLDDPARTGAPAPELDGLTVFVKSGDTWLIDDYTVAHG